MDRFRRLAIKIIVGFAGFSGGFIAGAGSAAQITGPVGAAFPEWGGLFIVGFGIWGGISGAALSLAALNHLILSNEGKVFLDCYLAKMQAAAARTKDGVVPNEVAGAISEECARYAKKVVGAVK
jgi:hypothetical protein